ncbi:MAG TPA: SRPBCC family protein [Solirubrobacteraceae bacterium]|nr:SRPBCC family protein [Solirubrobacteraceae bacterium]
MANLTGSRTVEIAAPVSRCFAIAADLDLVPEWHGVITAIRVLDRDKSGRATLVDTDMHAAVAQLQVRLLFSYEEPHHIAWTRVGGNLRSLEGSWRFQAVNPHRTLATYQLEIGVNNRLALLARTLRGPARARVETLLADRPVEGLMARAQRATTDTRCP